MKELNAFKELKPQILDTTANSIIDRWCGELDQLVEKKGALAQLHPSHAAVLTSLIENLCLLQIKERTVLSLLQRLEYKFELHNLYAGSDGVNELTVFHMAYQLVKQGKIQWTLGCLDVERGQNFITELASYKKQSEAGSLINAIEKVIDAAWGSHAQIPQHLIPKYIEPIREAYAAKDYALTKEKALRLFEVLHDAFSIYRDAEMVASLCDQLDFKIKLVNSALQKIKEQHTSGWTQYAIECGDQRFSFTDKAAYKAKKNELVALYKLQKSDYDLVKVNKKTRAYLDQDRQHRMQAIKQR